MTVAVIQPYFMPYAGYFRLFTAADVVVMFDCVQFPRRGWVHRNRMPLASGESDWFTLPIAKMPRDARISELRFASGASERIGEAMRRFPLLENARKSGNEDVLSLLDVGDGDVTAYLCGQIARVTQRLGISRPMPRSSALALPPSLTAADRVIAVVKAMGASTYVNPSGGRDLYFSERFAAEGIALRFLTPYAGSYDSILARLLLETSGEIAGEIVRETVLAA